MEKTLLAAMDDNVLPYNYNAKESSALVIPSTGTTVGGAAATANNMTMAIAMAPHSLLTYKANRGKQQRHISSSSSSQSLERQTSMIQHDANMTQNDPKLQKHTNKYQ